MKLWVDLESGTFGQSDNIVFIDCTDWTMDEIDYFTNLPDSERSAFSLDIIRLNNNLSPLDG
jgi:hypothetical protein